MTRFYLAARDVNFTDVRNVRLGIRRCMQLLFWGWALRWTKYLLQKYIRITQNFTKLL